MWILKFLGFEEVILVVVAVEFPNILGAQTVQISDELNSEILVHGRLDNFSWVHRHVGTNFSKIITVKTEIPITMQPRPLLRLKRYLLLRNLDC